MQLGRVQGIRSIAVFGIALFSIAILGIDVIGNGIAVFEFLGREGLFGIPVELVGRVKKAK